MHSSLPSLLRAKTDREKVDAAIAKVEEDYEDDFGLLKPVETEAEAAMQEIASYKQAKLEDQVLEEKQKASQGLLLVEDQAVVEV